MSNLNVRKGFESPTSRAIKNIVSNFDATKTRHAILDRTFNERYDGPPKMLFCFAVVKPAKKKVRKTLPKHNLKIKVTTASPLNEFIANMKYTYSGRSIYFTFMTNVWACLLGNASYPDLPVPRTDWDAEKLLYDNAKAAGQTDVANQHLANMIYMSKQNGVYVANSCGNSKIVFDTSGYIANKTDKGPSIEVGKAIIRGAKDTKQSGEVKIEIEDMPGTQFFDLQYQVVATPPGPMVSAGGTVKQNPTLKALPLVPILIFARANGPLNIGNWSIGYPYTPR
jgi:hypothetical protein